MKNLFTFFATTLLFVNILQGQDLIFNWATNTKGDGSHRHASITTDNEGNLITAGIFKGSTDFDPSGAVFNLTSTGSQRDIYIQKLSTDRNFLWAVAFECTVMGDVREVITDQEGNIYIMGNFVGTIDADPSANEYLIDSSSGTADGLLIKLTKDGEFLWASTYGPGGWNFGNTVLINSEGDVIVFGSFVGTVDFDAGPNHHIVTSQGQYDGYVTKLDSDGNFIWMKDIGGLGSIIELWSSNLDPDGNLLVTGGFLGQIDFDPGAGDADLISNGNSDIFALKLDPDGNYIWAKSFGSEFNDFGNHIISDIDGDIILTGRFSETCDFDPGPGTNEITSNGLYDSFVVKLNSQGESIWTKTIGGFRDELSYSIITDVEKNLYVTGSFGHIVDFDPDGAGFSLGTAGMDDTDTYFHKMDKNGNFIWAKSLGGISNEYGHGATFDIFGDIYLTGSFEEEANVHPEPGELYELTPIGNSDNFIIKLSLTDLPNNTENILLENEFAIFPNPTAKAFEVDFKNQFNNTLSIFDLHGKLIYQKSNLSGILKIELEQPSGVYFMEIENEQGVYTSKLTKQ